LTQKKPRDRQIDVAMNYRGVASMSLFFGRSLQTEAYDLVCNEALSTN
jgi:hypothetical protein